VNQDGYCPRCARLSFNRNVRASDSLLSVCAAVLANAKKQPRREDGQLKLTENS
jgi:hypothetical protein